MQDFDKYINVSKGLIRCPKCGKPLKVSDNPEYSYECLDCDEDFYSFECDKEES